VQLRDKIMSYSQPVNTVEDIYIKAPRIIDHHLADGRIADEIKEAKSILKEIISYCVNKAEGMKIVLDLEHTKHIGKSCIKILTNFAQFDSNFIICHPFEEIRTKLINNGFPEANIQIS
jgi:anti-anti-sigma regulatory factor